MKIAVVGKGGSGKSTVSYLLTSYFLSKGKKVLAVDADHNMDFSDLLGHNSEDLDKSFHLSHDDFRKSVGLQEDKNRSRIIIDPQYRTSFSLSPMDNYTEQVTYKKNDALSLQIVGLGDENISLMGRCAHGHTAPLKYYIPMLTLPERTNMIIDGVAGVDMVNFGCYYGCDVIICVIEPQRNSVKVGKNIIKLLENNNMPYKIIINKKVKNTLYTELCDQYGQSIITEIPVDDDILNYSDPDLSSLENVLDQLELIPLNKGYDRLQEYEKKKQQGDERMTGKQSHKDTG